MHFLGLAALLFVANALFSGDEREVITVDIATREYLIERQQELVLRDRRLPTVNSCPLRCPKSPCLVRPGDPVSHFRQIGFFTVANNSRPLCCLHKRLNDCKQVCGAHLRELTRVGNVARDEYLGIVSAQLWNPANH